MMMIGSKAFIILLCWCFLLKVCRGGGSDVLKKDEFTELDYILRPELEFYWDGVETARSARSNKTNTSGERHLQGTETTITVAVYFDDFPRETGFTVTSNGVTLADHPVGTFGASLKAKVFTETYPVQDGQLVTFTIFDTYADGIFEPGFYAIYYGSTPSEPAIIHKQDQFKTREEQVTITVSRPLTSAPTPAAPTFSPAPTHAPTTCIDPSQNAWQVTSPNRDRQPRFYTQHSAIPTTDLCSRHRTYIDCTNEQQEDCQWQFLTIGNLNGKCRVDPIAKCLQNGDCQCQTQDFNAGSDTMGDGLLFQAPIALTARDVSKYSNDVTYFESYRIPHDNDNQNHPQNPQFFVSRYDFTGRNILYTIGNHIQQFVSKTYSFNIHYLYMDTPIKGGIWTGLGISVSIDTSTTPQTLTVNGKSYNINPDIKTWTCTTVVITDSTIYIAGNPYTRSDEPNPPVFSSTLALGAFTGELFDVRVYQGTLSPLEILELGARCTTPDDTAAALLYKRDIENPYFIYGCDADFERLPADEGGNTPTDGKQTYGSGALATLWMKPEKDPFQPSVFLDVPEGEFDEQWFFQQKKLQHYLYERFYFDSDMIAMNIEPYRFHEDEDEVPDWSETFWDNPCRYINNFNNGWQFPIYGNVIAEQPTADFDLEYLYRNRNTHLAMPFWAHEIFHGLQGNLADVYSGSGSRWLAETTAEYASDFTFPTYKKIIAPIAYAPSFPLAFLEYRDAERGAHFMTDELSVSQWIRGGTVYATWMLWWFLSEFVGMPGAVGNMYSNWYNKHMYVIGELLYLRMLVENNNKDFGDVWSIAAAHMRTWDLPNRADEYRQAEEEDFQAYKTNADVQPPIPDSLTIENRKTSAEIDPNTGTGGQFIAGPEALRPGPHGWNCLTMRNIPAGQVISISLRWDEGLGFQPNTEPSWINQQQAGCDDDPRFYNNIIVAYNRDTEERRYFKAKGKTPTPVNIQIDGNTDIHIILMPSPPTDYIGGVYTRETDFYDDVFNPIPIYSYQYKVDVSSNLASGVTLTPAAPKENGIVQFEPATPGWWPIKCTCMDRINAAYERCVRPRFDGIGVNPISIPAPTATPTINGNDDQKPIIPPPPTSSAPTTSPGFCFSGQSEVDVYGKGITPMEQLAVGDKVLVRSKNDNSKYETVYSFGHRDEELSASFIQLLPSKLELSKNHMVFIEGKGFIPASAVRIGDMLILGNKSTDSNSATVPIEQIRTVQRQGVYNPFTPSGTIIVNGVLASNYIGFQEEESVLSFGSLRSPFTFQWLDHTFLFPHRIWCHYIGLGVGNDVKNKSNGFSSWTETPYRVSLWYIEQSPFIMVALFVPSLVIFGIFVLMEETLLLLLSLSSSCLGEGMAATIFLSSIVFSVSLLLWRRQRQGLFKKTTAWIPSSQR